MGEQGIIDTSTRFERGGAWSVVWKEHGTSRYKDLLLSFGFSGSYEEAVEKVVVKLDSDPFWARGFRGGVFFPVLVSAGVKVPTTGWRRRAVVKAVHL